MKRSNHLEKLRTEEFDCLIIGGGASGAGCALDSALRGYKTALVEKTDFAAATSSKSTKLIHGGVRYLEQAFKNFDFAQLAQVRHGLDERHTVLQNAPHLARPLALITPVFSWLEGLYFTIGLTIYGWFASGKDTLPSSKWLSKAAVKERIPRISEKIHSAVLYYDGQLDDARYCLAIAQTAAEAGAAVANHLEITGFEKNNAGQLTAAHAKDLHTGETLLIRAKVMINCTGPYADHIRQLANEAQSPRIRPSKGVHAILPYKVLGGEDALLIPKTPDGRVVFAIPFQGKLMLGTTDTEYRELAKEPQLEAAEIDFLLETLNPYLDQPVNAKQVLAGFGGLRPLIASDPDKGTKGLVRDHEVEHDKTSNLISLLGGKWTTYRLMAKDTIDYVEEHLLGQAKACTTDQQILVGGEGFVPEDWQKIMAASGLPADTCQHIHQHYGSRATLLLSVLEEKEAWKTPLVEGYPYLIGEAVYAARYEMAGTVRDFLARRIRLEILDWDAAQQAAGRVAKAMGQELGWEAAYILQAAEEYIEQLYALRDLAQA
ncbi:glycerol-3-phosphate dehydrogenase/oxidase [Lewinella sp. LCG006]|uniref:glycerol-3-phosphate dehydrogenase/oxidase n=1 Tax=Lewinella sp. LCG006 TaxID=3231911 RepID=UPI0034601C08